MPKNVKRKATDAADAEEPTDPAARGSAKKISRKDRLTEARRNAQAWAEAEKSKEEEKKKKAGASTVADESMGADDDNESPQAKKRVRVEDSPSKLKSPLQSAREAAKQWAEEEKMKMKKSVPATGARSPAPKSASVGKSPARATKSSSTPGRSKKAESTPVGRKSVGVSQKAVPNPMMGTVYPAGAFIVPQPGPGGAPMASGGYMMFVPGSPPFAQAASSDREVDDDDVPPPPALEQHISQQVLGNAQASLRNQPTVDSFHPDVHKAAVNVVGDEEIDETSGEDDSEPIVVDRVEEAVQQAEALALKKRADLLAKGAIVSAIIAILLYIVNFTTLLGTGMNNETPTLDCFLDSTPGRSIACPEGNGVPCPTGGVCLDGELVECSSLFHNVSVAKDSCIVAEQYKILTAALMDELEDQAKQACLGSNFPIVKYATMLQAQPEMLVEESPELVQLVLEVAFYVENDDENGLYIGLPDDHRLALPMSCHLSDAFKGSLETIGSIVVKFMLSLWSVFLIFLGVLWNCTLAYPLSSLIGFMTVCAIAAIKRADDAKRKKILCIANMRQMAYSTLQDNPQCPHLVVHIRDEIAFCLAENHKKERRYLIKDIWPTVVSDIKLDNRVRKSQRMVDGVPSDAWQWVAATTPKSTRFAPAENTKTT